MKKGLFVGSFNPITLAHERIANDLMETLDYLYYLPVNSKKVDLVAIPDRINMINLIINKNQSVLNILKYSKDGLFNINILNKLNLDITHIIMGSDLFFKFNTFKNYQEILDKYYLIVIKRELNRDINEYLDKYYLKYKDKIIFIDKEYDGSSTKALENLKKKENKYLNKKVLDYIIKNNLYNITKSA